MMTADLLRAYLDWQAEVGSDEVILPHPLGKPAAGKRDGPAVPAGAPAIAASAEPVPLFQSLAHALLMDAAGPKAVEAPAAAKPIRSADIVPYPAFAGLPEFWEYLETHPQALQAGDFPPKGIRGCGAAGAALALIGLEPSDADAAAGKVFQGEPGALLEKMMKAIRLNPEDLYLSNLVKIRIPEKSWSRRELARLLPLLHIELGLAGAPFAVLLGEDCARTVLKTGKTLDELRQETHLMEGGKFVVTYHPEELLRREELKRKAWEDLQWLQRRMAEAGAPA